MLKQGVYTQVVYCEGNCPGHATAEEAQEHFRQYILDKCEFTEWDEESKCRACGSSTKNVAKLASFLDQMGFVTNRRTTAIYPFAISTRIEKL